MAASQVIAQADTINKGEGASKRSSVSCLEPLLDEANQKLTQDQKAALKQMVDHYEVSTAEDESVPIPFDLSARKFPRSDSDVFSNLHHFDINWCNMICTAVIASLSSFIFGYVTVEASLIIDPSTPINTGAFNSPSAYPHLSRFMTQSLIPSCPLIGAAVGSISLFLLYPSVNTYSRKTILLLTNIPVIIGCILCVSTVSEYMLIAGLILKGFGFGISSVIAPIMLAEIAPTPIRQFITMFHQLFAIFSSSMICL